jgi:hypothetical protein
MYCAVVHCVACVENSFSNCKSSSQSEYSTHREKIQCFVVLGYYKMLYLLKPEPMMFCDNICFMNAFDALNYVEIRIDDVL